MVPRITKMPPAAAQAAWLEAESVVRAAVARVRLNTLGRLARSLPADDKFDAACAIWDDYIDGRRADERAAAMTTEQVREQASIFALLALHLSPDELLSLARTAWGTELFEVYTRDLDGSVTGKLGWFGDDRLSIRSVFVPDDGVHAVLGMGHVLDIWLEHGEVRSAVSHFSTGGVLALHPVFGRFDS